MSFTSLLQVRAINGSTDSGLKLKKLWITDEKMSDKSWGKRDKENHVTEIVCGKY